MAVRRFRPPSVRRPFVWPVLRRISGHPPSGPTWRWGASRAASLPDLFSSGRRLLHLPPVVMPPLIFTGLFLALWCWKCTMLILFQNAIIYTPYLPPDARRLRIADFSSHCGSVRWREERIRSLDGTSIALAVSHQTTESDGDSSGRQTRTKPPLYILYFQGNASSLPPRLPDISYILSRMSDRVDAFHCTAVCLSYRGYWTSHDRPSERGIDMDAKAALQWISRRQEDGNSGDPPAKASVIFWGQSIGCGFATKLAASSDCPGNLVIQALVLETPFTSMRAMLQALYPQRWLPYQYLWPFLRNQLDSWRNLEMVAQPTAGIPPDVFIVEAGADELVPREHGAMLYQRCQQLGLAVERHTVRGLLHNEVTVREEGRRAIAGCLATAAERAALRPGIMVQAS